MLLRAVLLALFLTIFNPLFAQELSYLSGPNPKGPSTGHIEFKAKFKKSSEWAYTSVIDIERKPTPSVGSNAYFYRMHMDLIDYENKKNSYDIEFLQNKTFNPITAQLKQWEVSNNALVFHKIFVFEESQLQTLDILNQKTESISTDKLTYPSDSIALLLMGIDFNKQDELLLRVILRGSGVYNITIKNLGKESIQTPAGRFLCHKLEIRPDLGFFNYLIGFAIPSIIYWQSVDEPYRPIQYEGPIGGPFSEHIQAKAQKIWFR